MLDTILALFTRACSGAWCARASLTGVIILTFWAVGHTADQRVADTKADGAQTAVTASLSAMKGEQARLADEIEKARKEAREANAETSKRLDELQKLLIQVLAEQRRGR